jgi:hypothetical protein
MSKRTIGNTSNVPVLGNENVSEGLLEVLEDTRAVGPLNGISRLVFWDTSRGSNTACGLSSGRHVVRDTDISELAIVSGARGFKRVPWEKSVGPEMVPSLIGSSLRKKIGQNKRVVVRSLSNTASVLIDKSRESNGVKTSIVGLSSVIRPLTTACSRSKTQE